MANEIVISSNRTAYKKLPKTHRDYLRPSSVVDFHGISDKKAKKLMDTTKRSLRRAGYKVIDKRKIRRHTARRHRR